MAAIIFKCFIGLLSFLHPFYVSVTEIEYNKQEKQIEIACKIFTDDFEAAIKKSSNVQLDFFNVKDKAEAEKAIQEYISKNLKLRIDGKAMPFKIVGFEKESEATWCYFEIPFASAPKKVEVENSILHDYNSNQINIMHYIDGKLKKSTKLNYPDRSWRIDL